MPRVIGTLTGQARTHHVDAPFVIHHLWSIIGDTGGVVSFILPSALALLSFHMSTGKLGSRPSAAMRVRQAACRFEDRRELWATRRNRDEHFPTTVLES